MPCYISDGGDGGGSDTPKGPATIPGPPGVVVNLKIVEIAAPGPRNECGELGAGGRQDRAVGVLRIAYGDHFPAWCYLYACATLAETRNAPGSPAITRRI